MTTLLSRSAIDDDPAGGTRAQGSPVASKGQVPAELLIVTQWYRPELIGTAFYSAERPDRRGYQDYANMMRTIRSGNLGSLK